MARGARGAVALAFWVTAVAGVKLNEVQFRGTHASYRLAPFGDVALPSLYLCQRPLDRQASYEAVRSFQFDIHKRQEEDDFFPVFHTNFAADNRTTCSNVAQCLWVLNRWSDANPGHLPIIIEFNGVDEPDNVRDDLRSGWPVALEQQIVEVLGEKVYRPFEFISDGTYPTINNRVKTAGWPDLDQLRGRFVIFATRYNSAVYNALNAFVASSNYPTESNVFFVAACGTYLGCNASDMNASWAAIADINFEGSDPAAWASDIQTIQSMVANGFIINSNVCSSNDTAYYNRQSICTNKSTTARELGVHILSDALLGVSNNDNLPSTTVCNPITGTTDCDDGEVATKDAPRSDPWTECDSERCQPAPSVTTTRAPDSCADNDTRIAELTLNYLTSCSAAVNNFPNVCDDDSDPYYDIARTVCPVTCGICSGARERARRTLVVQDEEPTEYNYTDPCGYITMPSSEDSGLNSAEWVGIIIGVVAFVMLVGLLWYCCCRKGSRRQYENLDRP